MKEIADKQEALAAVKENGLVLIYASAKLRDDKDVVMAAVEQNGWALEYASDRLKDDKDVVLAAVGEFIYSRAFQYASDRLKDDKEVVMAAVKSDGANLLCVSDRLKDDEEVVLAAMREDDWTFKLASDRLKHDYDFIIDAYKTNPGIGHLYEWDTDEETKRLIDSAKKMIEENSSLSSVLGKAEKASAEHNGKALTSRSKDELEK